MFREHLSTHPLATLPEQHRDAARAALSTAAGGDPKVALEAVSGGASGAIIQRVDIEPAGSGNSAASLLLRIETARDPFRNPHRSYPCLRTAATAGIAPPVHVADADAGVVVMDFIRQQPISEHPGGPAGVVRELGELARRLQTTPVFPSLLDDFATVLEQMLAMIEAAGVFAPGVLAPVHEGFEQIRTAYPWRGDAQVSSHNDVNPFNVLFDGDRLWLIDWEIAFRNDPFADIACVANNFIDPVALDGSPNELEDTLLQAWLGRAPDHPTRSRLALMRQLNRLFYGCLMMSTSIGQQPPEVDLVALTVDAFRVEVEAGRLALGSLHLLHALGKMQLAGFLAGLNADGFDETLRKAASG